MIDLAIDYDGETKAKNLKYLIDDLVKYEKAIVNNDDKLVVYIDYKDRKYNIFGEEIKD